MQGIETGAEGSVLKCVAKALPENLHTFSDNTLCSFLHSGKLASFLSFSKTTAIIEFYLVDSGCCWGELQMFWLDSS